MEVSREVTVLFSPWQPGCRAAPDGRLPRAHILPSKEGLPLGETAGNHGVLTTAHGSPTAVRGRAVRSGRRSSLICTVDTCHINVIRITRAVGRCHLLVAASSMRPGLH